MKRELKGKNIVITGGSKGIGRSIAMQLAGEGANVFLVARNKDALEEAKAAVQAKNSEIQCEVFSCDVSKNAEVVKTAKAILKASGGSIDGLINNAGTAHPEYFEKTDITVFEHTMAVDYFGGVYFTKALYPHINDGGFVSFTSSVVGFMGVFGYSSYAGPKFALVGLAETLQQEFLLRNIQVSVLCPPDTETPGYEIENQTKPYETMKMSESAKLMSPDKVAQIFLKKLKKGKFFINCNFESALFYHLHGTIPGLSRKIMCSMIKGYQKKKPS